MYTLIKKVVNQNEGKKIWVIKIEIAILSVGKTKDGIISIIVEEDCLDKKGTSVIKHDWYMMWFLYARQLS